MVGEEGESFLECPIAYGKKRGGTHLAKITVGKRSGPNKLTRITPGGRDGNHRPQKGGRSRVDKFKHIKKLRCADKLLQGKRKKEDTSSGNGLAARGGGWG